MRYQENGSGSEAEATSTRLCGFSFPSGGGGLLLAARHPLPGVVLKNLGQRPGRVAPEWLLLRLGSGETPAVPVLRQQGARWRALLTIVQVEGSLGESDPVEVDILLVDRPQPLYRLVVEQHGRSRLVNAIWPRVLNYKQLAASARAWTGSFGIRPDCGTDAGDWLLTCRRTWGLHPRRGIHLPQRLRLRLSGVQAATQAETTCRSTC